MKSDLSTYSVLSSWPGLDQNPDWKTFPAVNDMVDEYYGLVEAKEQFNQLRERLRSELRGESEKLTVRISAASAQFGNGGSLEQLKRNGDLVLANLNSIEPGKGSLSAKTFMTAVRNLSRSSSIPTFPRPKMPKPFTASSPNRERVKVRQTLPVAKRRSDWSKSVPRCHSSSVPLILLNCDS